MNKTKQRLCIICQKPFEYKTNPRRKTSKSYRSKHSLTCSPQCSRIYTRISHYFYSTYLRKKVLKSKKAKFYDSKKGWEKSYGYK